MPIQLMSYTNDDVTELRNRGRISGYCGLFVGFLDFIYGLNTALMAMSTAITMVATMVLFGGLFLAVLSAWHLYRLDRENFDPITMYERTLYVDLVLGVEVLLAGIMGFALPLTIFGLIIGLLAIVIGVVSAFIAAEELSRLKNTQAQNIYGPSYGPSLKLYPFVLQPISHPPAVQQQFSEHTDGSKQAARPDFERQLA